MRQSWRETSFRNKNKNFNFILTKTSSCEDLTSNFINSDLILAQTISAENIFINGSEVTPSGITPDLSHVLDVGNVAGTDIDMNNNNIVNVNNLNVSTINSSAYPPVTSSPDLSNVLSAGNVAGTDIDMNNNNITNVGNINLNTINSISFINKVVNGNGFSQSNVNIPIFTFPDSVASYSAKITYYWIDTVAGDDIPRQGVGYVSFRKKIGVVPSTTIPDTFVKSNWLFDGLNNSLIEYWTLTSFGLIFPRINQPSTFPAILISAEIQKTTY